MAGSTPTPDGGFMALAARRLTDAVDGFLASHQVLICDRDTKWTEAFRRIVEGAGVRIVQIPVQAPNAGNPGSPQTVGTAVESCFNAKLWLESRVLVLCPQHDVGSAGSVTDSLRGMQPASRSSCPGCEPGADPLGETLELRWCEVHAPSRAGLDDGRIHFGTQGTSSDEAGGEDNRRWCDLLHRQVR